MGLVFPKILEKSYLKKRTGPSFLGRVQGRVQGRVSAKNYGKNYGFSPKKKDGSGENLRKTCFSPKKKDGASYI